jgi:hypothetical protein
MQLLKSIKLMNANLADDLLMAKQCMVVSALVDKKNI